MSEGKSRHRPRRWLEAIVEHWVLSGLLPILPGWLGLALRYYGPSWGLISTQDPTTLGTLLIVASAVLTIGFALAKSAGVRFNLKVSKNNDIVLSRLLEAMNTVTRAKLNRFSAFVRERSCPLPSHPFEDITQPETQIERILQCLQEALGDLMGTGSANISVSLACQHDGGWHWLGRINADSDLHFGELTTNRNAAFHHVMIARSAQIIFYPDKQKAIADQKYIPGLQDTEDRVGSILVRRLEIETADAPFEVGLSVSTYGKQLCEQNDSEAREKILQSVLPHFETRLRLELCLYYIKKVMVKRSPSLTPPGGSASPVHVLES